MAKEDAHLHEEMGRLKIETSKMINKSINNGNPFTVQSKRSSQTICCYSKSKCPCSLLSKVKNNLVIKTKQTKILKKPVLQIIKTSINETKLNKASEEQQSSKSTEKHNIDILNLCTLVKDCNQLKISNESHHNATLNDSINESKWWRQELNKAGLSREARVQNSQSQTGSCSQQALNPPCDVTIDELASYFETLVHIPKKMSSMAEMMYI